MHRPPANPPPPVDLAIVGAGAAGLAAASAALRRRPAASVLLLDRLPAPGAKLAVTGGGRGNLSRLLPPDRFADAFGTRFVLPAFRAFPVEALRDFFASLAVPVPLAPDDSGALYPVSQSAPAVRDALLADLRSRGARLRLSAPVRSLLPPSPDAPFWTLLPDGDSPLRARAVLLAAGGQSAPALGSDGSGFALAAALGHRIVPPVPALAPILVDDAPWLPPLAGISLPDASLRLALPKRPPRISRGPLLFTHRGLSGPAALNLSADLARPLARNAPFSLALAVLPAPPGECRARLDSLRRTDGARPLRRALSPPLPQRLADALLALADVPPNTPASRLPAPAADRLATALTALPLSVSRPAPFSESMLTAGGVSLKDVAPDTLLSRLHPALAFAGEILDVQGPTGGYNLHFAFASAHLAARSLLP